MEDLVTENEKVDLITLAVEAKRAELGAEEIKALIWIIRGMKLGEELNKHQLAI